MSTLFNDENVYIFACRYVKRGPGCFRPVLHQHMVLCLVRYGVSIDLQRNKSRIQRFVTEIMLSTLNEPKSGCRSIFCFYRQIAFFSLSFSFSSFSRSFRNSLLFCFLYIFFFSLLILKLSIEKSRTMEAIHNGNRIAVGRFSDTVNVAIHRSTSKAA